MTEENVSNLVDTLPGINPPDIPRVLSTVRVFRLMHLRDVLCKMATLVDFSPCAKVLGIAVLCLTIGMLAAGCASVQSPILYPNAQLQRVGHDQAGRDIAACAELASQYVPSAAGKEVARSTGIGAIGGAAVGAVGGAVSGYGAGRGAAVGAATAGTAGAVRGIVKQTAPSPVYKNFVNRCLREKGYEVIGWQ